MLASCAYLTANIRNRKSKKLPKQCFLIYMALKKPFLEGVSSAILGIC